MNWDTVIWWVVVLFSGAILASVVINYIRRKP